MPEVVAQPQIDMKKFSGIFEAMNKSLIFQSSMLESLVLNADSAMRMEKERLLDEQRRQRIEDLEAAFEETERETAEHMQHGPDVAGMSGDPKQFALFTGIGAFLGDIFQKLTGGGLLMGAGLLGLRALIIAAIAKPLADFVAGAVEGVLKSAGAEDEFAKAFADEVGEAAVWGFVGLIFGKRVAAFFAAGKLIGSQFEKLITKHLDIDKEGNIVAFQGTFLENFAGADLWGGIGGIVAAFFGWHILKKATTGLFSVGGRAMVGATSAIGRGLLAGLKKIKIGPRFGIAAIAFALSEEIGDTLGEYLGNEAAGDTVSKAIKLGAAVALVNPMAGLITAAVILGGSAITSVADWLRNRKNAAMAELNKGLDRFDEAFKEDPNKRMTDDEVSELLKIKAENERQLQLFLSASEREMYESQLERAKAFLEKSVVLSQEAMEKTNKELMAEIESGNLNDATTALVDKMILMAEEISKQANRHVDLTNEQDFNYVRRKLEEAAIRSVSPTQSGVALREFDDSFKAVEADITPSLINERLNARLNELENTAIERTRNPHPPIVVSSPTSGPSTVDSSVRSTTNIYQTVRPDVALDYDYMMAH